MRKQHDLSCPALREAFITKINLINEYSFNAIFVLLKNASSRGGGCISIKKRKKISIDNAFSDKTVKTEVWLIYELNTLKVELIQGDRK